jgi:hypothetical protein
MKTETRTAMETAQMDARMVLEAAMDYRTPEAVAAHKANDKAERTCSAYDAAVARMACETWIDAHEDVAMAEIQKRIAARAAREASLARPLTDAERGM